MRLIIQRVTSAKVEVDGEVVSEIGRGLFVLVGITTGDTATDAEYLYASFTLLIHRLLYDSPATNSTCPHLAAKSCSEFVCGKMTLVSPGRAVLWIKATSYC